MSWKQQKPRSISSSDPTGEAAVSGGRAVLRAKRLADARSDYAWQTDPELARLDAAPLLAIPFSQYLAGCAVELRCDSPDRQRFAIETRDGRHIGNCTCYDINEAEGRAEVGILIGERDYWDKGYGTDAITALVGHIFRQTDLARVYLKTLETNRRAQRCFQKCGFIPCGRIVRFGLNFVLMELRREWWQRDRTNSGG